jgi:hypothetical protein
MQAQDERIQKKEKCPICLKRYTPKRRAPTTAGEYDLFDGNLKAPPLLILCRRPSVEAVR